MRRFHFDPFVLDESTGHLSRKDGAPIPLQPLTYQLLLLWVQQPHVLLSREALTERLWPDVVVSDDSLSQVIRRLRRALDGLDVVQTVHGRGYRFVAEVRVEERVEEHPVEKYPVEVSGAPVRRDRLPAPLDVFVGRRDDLAAVSTQIAQGERLIVLVGAVGVGKTRLAKEIGRQTTDRDVWFVDLAHEESLDGLVRSVARAMDLPANPHLTAAAIGDALAGQPQTLLLLDNLEQLSRPALDALEQWLGDAPEVVFLATSRSVLGIRGERVVTVEPLPINDAVALFVERSGVDPADPVLPDLVRALDCLPLAIELAAPRIRIFPPARLLDALGERFALLKSTASAGRHTSLQAALDDSWALLSDPERAGLVQLCSFVGSFDLDDALFVLGDLPSPLDLLQSLVDRCWLRSSAGRFGLLLSVHQYVVEQADRSALQAAWEVHGRAMARLGGVERIRQARRQPSGPHIQRLIDRLDDIIAACRRAVERGDGEVASETALLAWEVLRRSGPVALAVELLRAAAPLGASRYLVKATLGNALMVWGRYEEALGASEEALALARQEGEVLREGMLREQMAMIFYHLAAPERARTFAESALTVLTAHDDTYHIALCNVTLGQLAWREGDIDGSLALYRTALALFRTSDDPQGQALALGNIGIGLQAHGRTLEAMEAYQEALALERRSGNRPREANVRGNLATLLAQLGKLEEAADELHSALEITRDLGQQARTALHLMNFGLLSISLDQLDQSRTALDEALRLNRRLGRPDAESSTLIAIGRLHLREGAPERAWLRVCEAMALLGNRPGGGALGRALLMRAEIHLRNGRLAAASEDLAAATPLLEAQHFFERGILRCIRAQLHHARGEDSAAWDSIAEATNIADGAGLGERSLLRLMIAEAWAKMPVLSSR